MKPTEFPVLRAAAGVVLFATLTAAPAAVQARSEQDAAMEKANQALEHWHQTIMEFTGDVRFGEKDIESFMEHYPALNELDDDEKLQDRFEDEEFDFDDILADKRYRQWASERGLHPEKWLRRSMRIVAMVSRELVLQQFGMAEKQLPQQRQQLESMREQMGEEAYKQSLQAMDSYLAMMRRSRDAWSRLEPTKAEQALLDAYRAQLVPLVMDEDDDSEDEEDWEEEQYPGEEEEDYYDDGR